MKMIVAIIQDKDSNLFSSFLAKENIKATKVASTRGLLRAGNTTFIITVQAEQVDHVLNVIQHHGREKEHLLPVPSIMENSDCYMPLSFDVDTGGITVFVLAVERCVYF